MKKLYTGLLLMLIISACSVEVEPRDKYSDGVAWKDETNLDMYVKGFYAGLRDNAEIYTNTFSDGLSDILKYSVNNLNSTTFQNKTLLQENYITANNGVLSEWGNYARIKRLNEFLYNSELKASNFSPEFINIRKAEVRFIRAYLYFELARNHGGFILRLENTGVNGLDSNKDANKARLTEDESWQFIIDELIEAGNLLKDHRWDAANFGRITEGSVYAFLSRVGVYAKKYDVAINAGNKVASLGYKLDPSYDGVFNNLNSVELILPVMFDAPDYVHFVDRYFQPSGDIANRGAWASPTEELVSNYQIKKGGVFVDFNWNNPDHTNNPYIDREPRFYSSILYNGASWKGRKIETFEGGKDVFVNYDPNSDNPGNVTGYFMRKFLTETITDVDLGSTAYWVFFRMAEVYLNMAEAYAETSDFNKAYNYLNKVRIRAGISPRPVGATLAVFKEQLSQERMLELAFEGHRYWDLRRWKMAEEKINGKRATGVQAIKHGDGSVTYNRVAIETSDRYFPSKYYLIPIPQSEMLNNSLATQNLNW